MEEIDADTKSIAVIAGAAPGNEETAIQANVPNNPPATEIAAAVARYSERN